MFSDFLSVRYKTNIKDAQIFLRRMPKAFGTARKSALVKGGVFLIKEVSDWIASEGEGTWPGLHPISKKFRKEFFKKGSRFRPRFFDRRSGALKFLASFPRYRTDRKGFNLTTGFSDSGRGQFDPRFDRNLMKAAERAEEGARFRVTSRRRRLFGGSRAGRKAIPGKDFFPLRKTTRLLRVPKRPIKKPILQRNQSRLEELFGNQYFRFLKNDIDRIRS